MGEVPLSRLCRESPLTPGRARHTLGSWWGWLFHPHRLPHGECGVWGRAPGRTRYAWQLRHLEAHQSRDRRDTSSRCDDSSKARVVTHHPEHAFVLGVNDVIHERILEVTHRDLLFGVVLGLLSQRFTGHQMPLPGRDRADE